MVFAAIALVLAGQQPQPLPQLQSQSQPESRAQPTNAMPPVMIKMVKPSALEGGTLRMPEEDGYICTMGYGDCLRVVSGDSGGSQLAIFDADAGAADIPAVPLPVHLGTDDTAKMSVWDRAIRLPNRKNISTDARSYLVGIIRSSMTFHAGGYDSGEHLYLYKLTIARGEATLEQELLSLPWTFEASIRACFSREDDGNRRGACEDIYRYTPLLDLKQDEGREDVFPALAYQTTATTFPRTARRGQDSRALPRLTAADLTEWRDPDCSYARTLRYNMATKRYEMDSLPPDCSSYSVP